MTKNYMIHKAVFEVNKYYNTSKQSSRPRVAGHKTLIFVDFHSKNGNRLVNTHRKSPRHYDNFISLNWKFISNICNCLWKYIDVNLEFDSLKKQLWTFFAEVSNPMFTYFEGSQSVIFSEHKRGKCIILGILKYNNSTCFMQRFTLIWDKSHLLLLTLARWN